MSQFSNANFDAINYAKYRPKYTNEIYDKIRNYHKGGNGLLIDVGCGPGTATIQMVDKFSNFSEFIGTDLSQKMIGGAVVEQKKYEIPESKLKFCCSPCDDFQFLPNGKKADMITAVECAHWFDFEKFQKAAYEKLNENGTLAVWCYCKAEFPQYPKVNEIIREFRESDEYLGPYMEQPGHGIINDYYRSLKFNPSLFKDIDESIFFAKDAGKDSAHDKMLMQLTVPLKVLKYRVTTSSAYQGWKAANPNSTDLSDIAIKKIIEAYPELTEDSIVNVTMSTVFKFARKR